MVLLSRVLAATEEHHLAELFMPPVMFAVIAAAIFVALALVTWSYRDVANRHRNKTTPADPQDAHH